MMWVGISASIVVDAPAGNKAFCVLPILPVISSPMKRHLWAPSDILITGVLSLRVVSVGIPDTCDGPTRWPGNGKLARALETTTIHPAQEVAGMVKFPV